MLFKNSLNILVVEDNEGDYFLLQSVFEQSEIELKTSNVKTLNACIESLEKEKPDVVLLDLGLPDSDDLDGVEKLRSIMPNIPIVVHSGNDDFTIAQEAINAGADDYLVKGTISPWHIIRTLSFAIERRKLYEQINKLAKYDSLTGVANRSTFLTQLEQCLKRIDRNHSLMALMYLDLDHFKPVNDNFGHKAGDLLLEEVAKRITESIRNVDVVARLGGDEFAIILDEIDSVHGASIVAEKLIENLSKPFNIEDKIVCIGASIGIVCINDHIETVNQLIEHADSAMYTAKNSGGNQFILYESMMGNNKTIAAK